MKSARTIMLDLLLGTLQEATGYSRIGEVREVLRHGDMKHGHRRRLQPAAEHIEHAARHLQLAASGSGREDESGLPHTAHAACRCFLAFVELTGHVR